MHASGCFNQLQLEKSLKSNHMTYDDIWIIYERHKTIYIKPCEWFWDLDTDHEGKAMALMLLHNSWNLLSVEDALHFLHLQSWASAVSQNEYPININKPIVQVLNPSCGPAMAEEAHVAKMAGSESNYFTGNIPGPSCWESWVGSSHSSHFRSFGCVSVPPPHVAFWTLA